MLPLTYCSAITDLPHPKLQSRGATVTDIAYFLTVPILSSLWAHLGLLNHTDSRKAAPYTRQHNHSQTAMPRVGFEPTTPVFKGAKIVHALDSAAIVIGV
jgi:hypothetical protein